MPGTILRLSVGALCLLAALPRPAEADAIFAGDTGCFLRRYDARHLAAHPRQTVEAMRLSRNGSQASDPAGGASDLVLAFRAKGRTFAATAYCKGSGCILEGDGGAFTLRRIGWDLELAVTGHLSLEGADGFSDDLASSADDRVFRLRPAPRGACSATDF